jgi:hypothetical protein
MEQDLEEESVVSSFGCGLRATSWREQGAVMRSGYRGWSFFEGKARREDARTLLMRFGTRGRANGKRGEPQIGSGMQQAHESAR